MLSSAFDSSIQKEHPAHLHIAQCASECAMEQKGSHLIVKESSPLREVQAIPVSRRAGQNLHALHLHKSQWMSKCDSLQNGSQRIVVASLASKGGHGVLVSLIEGIAEVSGAQNMQRRQAQNLQWALEYPSEHQLVHSSNSTSLLSPLEQGIASPNSSQNLHPAQFDFLQFDF